MTPRHLHCYDDMVIVTHAVYWQNEECDGNSQAMKIIQSLCDGRNSCYIEHSRSILGGSCLSTFEFTMYYSCQTGEMSGRHLVLRNRYQPFAGIRSRPVHDVNKICMRMG